MSLQAPPNELVTQFRPVYEYLIGLSREMERFDPTLQFTSWWRTEAQNRSVGGQVDSQHLFGFAFDFVSDRSREIEQALNQAGLFAVRELDHVHVQLLPAGTLRRLGFFARTIEV